MAPLPRGIPIRGHSAKSRLGGRRPSSLRPLVHERQAAFNLSQETKITNSSFITKSSSFFASAWPQRGLGGSEAQPRTSGPSTLRSICRPQDSKRVSCLLLVARTRSRSPATPAKQQRPPSTTSKAMTTQPTITANNHPLTLKTFKTPPDKK